MTDTTEREASARLAAAMTCPATIWVNMTDKFMSGWGGARNGRSLYCIACDTRAQADAIEKAAQDRSEMRHVTIAHAPRRMRRGDHRSLRHVSELSGPWLTYMHRDDRP